MVRSGGQGGVEVVLVDTAGGQTHRAAVGAGDGGRGGPYNLYLGGGCWGTHHDHDHGRGRGDHGIGCCCCCYSDVAGPGHLLSDSPRYNHSYLMGGCDGGGERERGRRCEMRVVVGWWCY